MNPILTSATLKTILNNAPMIIQGTSKLIQMIKEKNEQKGEEPDDPVSMEGLHEGLEKLEQRLDATDESNIEQIKLIEELARQNEAMAASLNKTYARINLITLLSIAAMLLGLLGIYISINP